MTLGSSTIDHDDYGKNVVTKESSFVLKVSDSL